MLKQVGVQTIVKVGAVTGSVGVPTAAESGVASAIVSGAGTAAANGTYTPRGTENGKPYYNLLGQPDSVTNLVIVWNGAEWDMNDSSGNLLYLASDSVAFPWLGTWLENVGDPPAPTVTEG